MCGGVARAGDAAKGDTLIEQSLHTKDAQAMKIFEWAAGAASLRMAYLGLKLGLFEAHHPIAVRPLA